MFVKEHNNSFKRDLRFAATDLAPL
jgi:hypothetical protein